MFEVRPLPISGDLRLRPGRKLGIGVGQHLVRPGLKPLNFRVYVERAFIGGLTQFRDAGLKRRYRLFEIEKTYHGPALRPSALQVNERMTRIDQFDEAAAVYMSIDLRGADIGMPQHDLQSPQVRAALQ